MICLIVKYMYFIYIIKFIYLFNFKNIILILLKQLKNECNINKNDIFINTLKTYYFKTIMCKIINENVYII